MFYGNDLININESLKTLQIVLTDLYVMFVSDFFYSTNLLTYWDDNYYFDVNRLFVHTEKLH